MMTPHVKYFSQTNETAMESEQMKVVLHGHVDLYIICMEPETMK